MSANEHSAAPEPVPVAASGNATLLLTEADFAPPEAVLPILLRIAGFAILASAAGAAAYLGLALVP